MRKMYWTLAIVIIILMGLAVTTPRTMRWGSWTAEAQAKVLPVNGDALGVSVMKILGIVRPELSVIKKQILARTFVRVATDVLETEEQGRYFAILVAIESKYQADAISSAGAIGMAQLMPATAKQFSPMCGIKDFAPDDLKDTEINLTIGACVFRALLTAFHGNLAEALVAYNAGSASLSLKQLQSLSNITNDEPPRYIAKFMYLEQVVNKTKKM